MVDRHTGLAHRRLRSGRLFHRRQAEARPAPISNCASPARSGASATKATAPPSRPIRRSICRASAATIRSAIARGAAVPGHPLLWAGRRASGFISSIAPRRGRPSSPIPARVIAARRAQAGRRCSATLAAERSRRRRLRGCRIAPGDEARHAEIASLRRRSAARRRPASSRRRRRPPRRRGRRRCPIREVGAEPRIDVGRAFGDAAELQRRAAGDRARPARSRSRKASVAGSRCERLTSRDALAGGPARGCGCGALARGVGAAPGASAAARRRGRRRRARSGRAPAPRPRRRPACRRATSAMLTVYSSRPARNSRVPSSGSTRMKRAAERPAAPAAGASSDTTGTPGSSRARPRG